VLYLEVNTCKLNYWPRRNKIVINVWTVQTYLIHELVHQCDVRNCLADKISCAFGPSIVVPITKIDLKLSCDYYHVWIERILRTSGTSRKRWSGFWWLLSELWHFKEAVKRFLVAVVRTVALPRYMWFGIGRLIVPWFKNQLLSAYQEKIPARNAIYAHAQDFSAGDELLQAILKAFIPQPLNK